MQNKIDLSTKYHSKVILLINYPIVVLSFFILTLSSCGINHTPVESFKDQDEKRHKKTEEFLKSEYPNKNYKSLAFGKTIIYKPPSFNTLDSLYAVKQEYIDNDEIRELKTSGVEDMIENHRPIAQQDIDEIKYEFEHIYYLTTDIGLQVNHDFFVFDYKDSLITHTPFYNYSIPSKWKELHNKYLFEFHFVTDRDLYISGREREFISHFKAREEELIGEEELQSFMTHTLSVMTLANQINSVDFNLLTKQLGLNTVKFISENSEIESFGTLIALEDENSNILGYERTVRWSENENIKETIITFNEYLEFENMETINKGKEE